VASQTALTADAALGGVSGMTEAVIESSPLAMFAVDANGAVCFWNTAAEKEFGWSKGEIIGRETPFADELRRKDGSEVRAAVWTAPMTVGGNLEAKLTIVARS
jgi:PAS domain-containing protein